MSNGARTLLTGTNCTGMSRDALSVTHSYIAALIVRWADKKNKRNNQHHDAALKNHFNHLEQSHSLLARLELCPRGAYSSLVCVLPLVSRHFYFLCKKSDHFWRDALERLVHSEPYLWEEGVRMIRSYCDEQRRQIHGTEIGDRGLPYQIQPSLDPDIGKALITSACESLSLLQENAGDCINRKLFSKIVSGHLRCTAPVFCMPGSVQLGREFGLHFFEPRYRQLIADVMTGYPELTGGRRIKKGEDVEHYPTFLYANTFPIERRTPICLVQVRQCMIYSDGRADVLLVPCAYVWIEFMWEVLESDGLFYGRGQRMSLRESHAYEECVRDAARVRYPYFVNR
eukprot:scaffold41442_cov53-Attheya_sp.AAC.4